MPYDILPNFVDNALLGLLKSQDAVLRYDASRYLVSWMVAYFHLWHMDSLYKDSNRLDPHCCPRAYEYGAGSLLKQGTFYRILSIHVVLCEC